MNRTAHAVLAAAVLLLVPSWSAAQSLPDPTRPSDYSDRPLTVQDIPGQERSWILKAIKSSGSGRKAIINGELVEVGDELDSARVLEINSNSVVLDQGRNRIVLKLIPDNIKLPHGDSNRNTAN